VGRTERAEVRRFVGHLAGINAVALSADGKYALTGSADGTARLWDVQSGAELHRFVGHIAGVVAVAFSPDGQYVFTGSDDRTARMWATQNGSELRRFTGYTGSVVSLAVSPDSKYLVTAGNNVVSIWQVVGPGNLATFTGHSGSIFAAAFSPDGTRLITGGKDKTVRVWDIHSRQQVKQITMDNAVVGIAVSPDGNSVFIIDDQSTGQRGAGSGSTIGYLWNTRTGAETDQRAIAGTVYSVAFSPDGKYLMDGDSHLAANVWDARTETLTCSFPNKAIVGIAAFSANGKTALTRSRDGTAGLWNTQSCGKIRDLADPTLITSELSPSPESAAISPDGSYVLTGNPDGGIRLWDAYTGAELQAFIGHVDSVRSAAFSPDSNYVLTGSADQTARLWDRRTGQLLRVFTTPAAANVVAFSPDGGTILVATDDGVARVWDFDYLATIQSLCAHLTRDFTSEEHAQFGIGGDSPTCPKALVQATPETSSLAESLRLAIQANNLWNTTGGDRQLALLLATRAAELSSLPFARTVLEAAVAAPQVLTHSAGVTGLAISPDGRYVLTASQKIAYLWDRHSGQQIRTFTGHGATINAVAFSPDGKTILTGSDDHTARLWDVQTGMEVRQLKGHTTSVLSVAFSPDGKTILTGSGGFSLSGDTDTTARLWSVQTGNEIEEFLHQDWVYAVMFSPDGKYALTASQDKTAQLWNIKTGQIVRTFSDPARQANGWSVAFAPDGKSVLSVTWDGTVVLWDVSTGKPGRQFSLPNDKIGTAIFSPDGKYILASEASSKTVTLLDLQSGSPLASFAGHSDSITGLAFSSDGTFVATTSKDGTALLWSTDTRDLVTRACALISRDFTDAERSTYGISASGPTCPQPDTTGAPR